MRRRSRERATSEDGAHVAFEPNAGLTLASSQSSNRMRVERTPAGTSAIDVLDHVIDKGIVIDAWLNVSIVGIDLITVEARVVVASFETYLRHSEALSRALLVSRNVGAARVAASATPKSSRRLTPG